MPSCNLGQEIGVVSAFSANRSWLHVAGQKLHFVT
jgi:hypothetical protein